ncbi:hypothetical protein HOF56_02385 [Candidatus Peribacteria bacterium]|jgi:hypothetical protein|nr:hypothetical protein [Candidatus Peribacteria bacterium]MBT4021042.1 hypothetical protein [Candidatus Peribacteria bacterium]MBT4240763.1 hypothetical protein [Candidatus Peribacteria bacterium]MBT4474208.1 hypothetical protein [Candidatus Peribacteria bacterium]
MKKFKTLEAAKSITKIFSLLLGISLAPTKAIAVSLSDIGNTNAGIAAMWTGIMTYMAHPGDPDGIGTITGIVIGTVLLMIGSAAVAVILYASIKLITSGGNDETVRKAWKEMIFYAVLGLLFAILSETIMNYVISLVSTISAS